MKPTRTPDLGGTDGANPGVLRRGVQWCRRKPARFFLVAGFVLFFVLCIVAGGLNLWIVSVGAPHVYDRLDAVPRNDVAVLLGTTRWLSVGGVNPYFQGRIDAAAALYHAGKVCHILASGSNPTSRYNEPVEMRKALVARGVPASAVTLDYAGFRTLDSVVRARRVFGLRRFTIVSQRYHNYRAVFLARRDGSDAVAYSAPRVPDPFYSRYRLREVLARVKAILDLYVLGTQPRYLGDPEPIMVAPTSETVPTGGER